MRHISSGQIRLQVKKLIQDTVRILPADVWQALKTSSLAETSPSGRETLRQLLENADYARQSGLPLCQDTGLAVFFAEAGLDAALDEPLEHTLTRATAEAYREGFLRRSACHPLSRANTNDNTPVFLHLDMVPGDKLVIHFMPKGGGAENMSAVRMLSPAEGRPGVKNFVLDTVAAAGPNPCPPIVVGVCVGASFDQAPLLAKKALLRPIGTTNPDPDAEQLEQELLAETNRLNIGPGGLGGKITALAVHVVIHACHIACLPVAVNIQCNSARAGTLII